MKLEFVSAAKHIVFNKVDFINWMELGTQTNIVAEISRRNVRRETKAMNTSINSTLDFCCQATTTAVD